MELSTEPFECFHEQRKLYIRLGYQLEENMYTLAINEVDFEELPQAEREVNALTRSSTET